MFREADGNHADSEMRKYSQWNIVQVFFPEKDKGSHQITHEIITRAAAWYIFTATYCNNDVPPLYNATRNQT